MSWQEAERPRQKRLSLAGTFLAGSGTSMRPALDTSLRVCAEGFGDDARVNATRQLLTRLSDADLVLNVAAEGGARLLLACCSPKT